MKKFDSQRSVTFLYHGLCILIIMLFSACADGDDPASHVSEASEVSETGSVAFRVVWKDVLDTESASGKTERKLNCAESDVETVEANVYDENDENGEPIADGGPWSCSLGKASIEDVPAGSQRRIVVRGKDSEGRVLHQGEAEDVRVLAGQSTPPVLIEMRRVAPEVFINSPSENKVFTEGETITFSGSATDPEDGGDLSLAWTISMGGESVDSATGTSFTRDNLAQGDYTAELTATDSGGLTDTASVMFTVKGNTPPSVTIIRPSANEVVFTEGEAITFDGSANDPEDGELTGESLVWTLSVNGYPLSESIIGGSFEKDNLDSGNYAAKLTATDRGGLTKSASVSFTVKGNSPPSVTIIRPSANEVVFTEGEAITFDGSASDPDEDGADLSLAWGIRQDESQIYSTEGGSFEKNDLSPGIYTATLTATDSREATGSASVSFMVKGNSPPSVTIIRPSANEVVFTEGETITFSGSATDPEDGELTEESFVWTLSVNGDPFDGATGGSLFTSAALYPGNYTVELTATDSGGLTDTASVTFRVNVESEVVEFPDANLEAAIREAIQKPDGDIYASDLEGLTELFAVGREIENLEGLEYCTNLTLLNLGTTGETSNSIADISPLTELTSLTSLSLYDNQISDISALASLTGLTSLSLGGNEIINISALASLTALTELSLFYNQISDISVLASLTALTYLYLGNNPLSDTSCAVYIPELEERGATVTHDCGDEVQYTITATHEGNGSINPPGAMQVYSGDNQTFTMTPVEGYKVLDVLVDNESVGAVNTYTFVNVSADHAIYVTFTVEDAATGVDRFTGDYTGNYSADSPTTLTGDLTLNIDSQGAITGTARDSFDSTMTVTGTTDAEGNVSFTYTPGSGQFSGTVDDTGYMTGTWSDGDFAGTFSASRQ